MKKYTIEQFMKNIEFDSVSISKNGERVLFTSDEDGSQNVYLLNLATSEKRKMTQFNETVYINSFVDQNGESFLFSMDEGGNELSHIYIRNTDGTFEDLTPVENSKMTFYKCDSSGNGFYYYSNYRNKRYFDIVHHDIRSGEKRIVYVNDEYDSVMVSDDEKYIAMTKSISDSDKNLFVLDRFSGEINEIFSDREEEIVSFISGFSKTCDKLYFQTDAKGEFLGLFEYDVNTREIKEIYSSEWDVGYQFSLQSVFETHDGKYLIFPVNENASMKIRILDNEKGNLLEFVKIPPLKFYTGIAVSDDANRFAFISSDSASPSDIYVFDIDKLECVRITDSINPEINQEDLVKCEKVCFKSRDGVRIPALLYKPHITGEHKVAAMIFVHGGPGGQCVDEYDSQFQYMLNNGIAILAVNNRGSSGYGKDFFKAAFHKHGEADLNDCVDAMDFLKTLDFIDNSKIGIFGSSYGGYMTLAALAFAPETFKIGIDIYGISNWLRTLSEIPPWWGNAREVLFEKIGNPETEADYLKSISPLFHAERIKVPLMVLQGSNDPRVLKIESDEIVEKVRNKGIPVEYVVFEDEGHGFRKVRNQIEANKKILEFILKYI